MIGRLIHLARGQVRVRVTGASLTRFLNVCAANNIVLRRMRRKDWNELYAVLSVEDFRILRRHMGRTGCRVHIVSRRGAPFWIERVRPRYVLWGGLLVLLALCWTLSTRIWSIETHISPGLSRGEILEQLDTLGVHVGTRRSAVDAKRLRWKVLQKQPEIGFFALNVQGNRLTVEATKAVEKPEMLDEEAVVKLVATRDGVIASQRVQEGEPQFEVGDAVRQGETLVSGLVPPRTETGAYRLAHSRGQIEAYTSYDVTAVRALTTERKTYTGKEKTQYALTFGKRRLNLYFGSGISGGTCDKIVETKTAWLSESVVFPISLVKQTYRYYERTPETAAPETVAQDMTDRALGDVTAQLDGEALAHTERVAEQNGAAVLQLNVKAREQIAMEALDDSEIPQTPPEPAETP